MNGGIFCPEVNLSGFIEAKGHLQRARERIVIKKMYVYFSSNAS